MPKAQHQKPTNLKELHEAMDEEDREMSELAHRRKGKDDEMPDLEPRNGLSLSLVHALEHGTAYMHDDEGFLPWL